MLGDLKNKILEKSTALTNLQNRKRELYAMRNSRKVALQWSESDEQSYNESMTEINQQIANTIKQDFDNSSLKSKIEAEIMELVDKSSESIQRP